MGIDCMIFAKRAKRCIYLDRHYHVGRKRDAKPGWWWIGWLEAMDEYEHEPHGNSAPNRAKARAFIMRHGADDEYFVVTDNMPTGEEYYEIRDAGGFVEEDRDG